MARGRPRRRLDLAYLILVTAALALLPSCGGRDDGGGVDVRVYKAFADEYYDRARFKSYVRDTVAAVNPDFPNCQTGDEYHPVKCDSLIDFYFPLAHDDDFYEQIDIGDRFAFGWSDWVHRPEYIAYWAYWEDPEAPIPEGVDTQTALRQQYRNLRRGR